MRKAALTLCLVVLTASAAPQVSSFYDPELDDWIVYALNDAGGLYLLRGDGFDEVTRMPGGGPFDLSAFYDAQLDDWIVYAFNGAGELYALRGNEFRSIAKLP